MATHCGCCRRHSQQRTWSWLGCSTTGGIPPALELEGVRGEELQTAREPFWSGSIPYRSSFNHPNRWESEFGELLVDELTRHPAQRRPLLVLPAMPSAGSAVLRALL